MSLTNKTEGIVPMSIYSVLKGEHAEVNALFKTLKATPAGKEAVYGKIKKELLSHAKAEQETIYRRLAEKLEDEDMVDEAVNEHSQIENLLDSIDGVEPKSDLWNQEVETLEEKVKHHVEEEEHDMFDRMRQIFDDDEAKEIAKEFREAKKAEMESMAE